MDESWDQARTVPNSLVSEKGATLVASIKVGQPGGCGGNMCLSFFCHPATVAGMFGDTAVQKRWDQADAAGTLQALRQAYCRTLREAREAQNVSNVPGWHFTPLIFGEQAVLVRSDPFHPMVRIAITALDMAIDL
eukprot:Skav233858  [mRNA]  locus=scaffold33:46668:56009:- [translate_table: standard]